jgi:2-keto-4-pentenoate hydratase
MSEASIFQNPKSGSIKVTGEYQVVDEQGAVIKTLTDPKLCGCGLSQDKPLCDKSHANYVSIVARALEDARVQAKAISPFGTWALRAFEIRKRDLENRIANGEKLLGIKFGGALIKSDSKEKNYEGIFGYLTDAMQINGEMQLSRYIAPIAEAEIVFKLAKDLDRAITLEEVSEFVHVVAPGIEVFDCRYGAIDPYIDDAVADNACAGGIVIGDWVDISGLDLTQKVIEIYENGALNQTVSATAIAGNPWLALVNASEKLAQAQVSLPAGSIIFSGSATKGIPMKRGAYKVKISDLGEVALKVN